MVKRVRVKSRGLFRKRSCVSACVRCLDVVHCGEYPVIQVLINKVIVELGVFEARNLISGDVELVALAIDFETFTV